MVLKPACPGVPSNTGWGQTNPWVGITLGSQPLVIMVVNVDIGTPGVATDWPCKIKQQKQELRCMVKTNISLNRKS